MLIAKLNGSDETLKEGDKIKDFRGEESTFIQATRPNSYGRQGKVLVKHTEGSKMEYYASVFNIHVYETDGEPR